jgi:hypothetical protein
MRFRSLDWLNTNTAFALMVFDKRYIIAKVIALRMYDFNDVALLLDLCHKVLSCMSLILDSHQMQNCCHECHNLILCYALWIIITQFLLVIQFSYKSTLFIWKSNLTLNSLFYCHSVLMACVHSVIIAFLSL